MKTMIPRKVQLVLDSNDLPARATQVAQEVHAILGTGLAPNCVLTGGLKQDFFGEDAVTVYNTCGFTVRVKTVLAFAADLKCLTISPATSLRVKWQTGRFDRLETC
jgi:hypothetical protein